MQTKKNWEDFKTPFRIIAIVDGERYVLCTDYKTFDGAGMDMHKIRAGNAPNKIPNIRLTTQLINGELLVEDCQGNIVYKMLPRCE